METDENEPPIPLETLGDVRRALASALRKVAKGRMDTATGHTLIIGYGTLAKMMQDARDSRFKKHVAVLWAEHEAAKGEPAQN